MENDYKLSVELQKGWLDACMSVGIPAITTDTSARIFAIMAVHGGENADFTHNRKYLNDVEYIAKRFHVEGGEVPDMNFAIRLKGYEKELRKKVEANEPAPEWAMALMQERYGIKIR